MAKKKVDKIIQPEETVIESDALEEPVNSEIIEDQQVELLKKELSDAEAKSNEYLEGWQRSRAEFANYKKRIEREQAEVYQRAAGMIIRRYLEVLDDLELALKNRPTDQEGAISANGIELIYRKLTNILESEGVKPIQSEGELFDPNVHEAISMESNPAYQSGQVIEVLKQGYWLGDRVLRHALVRVAQ